MSVATLKGIEQFTEYPIQNRNSGISLVLAPEKTIFEKFTCDLFLFCLEKMDFMFTVYYLNLIEKKPNEHCQNDNEMAFRLRGCTMNVKSYNHLKTV